MKIQYLILLLLCTFLLISTQAVKAQVSNYTFDDNATGLPYVSFLSTLSNDKSSNIFRMETATQITQNPHANRYLFMNNGSPSADTLATGPGYPIGFDFKYDGQVFDRFGISANLYLKLAHSKNGNFSMKNDTVPGSIFESGYDSLRRNIIAPFQKSSNLTHGNQLIINHGTYGYPGERYFLVQLNYRTGGSSRLSPLVAFKEFGNEIIFGYYAYFIGPSTLNTVYVGIRGNALNNSASNIFSRSIISGTNTWTTSDSATSPADSCHYGPNIKPPHVTLFTFTPPLDTIKPKEPIAYFDALNDHPQFIIAKFTNSISFDQGYILATNAIDVPINPTLKWSPEKLADSIFYDVYLGLDSLNLNLLADSLKNTEYDLPTLVKNTQYYYQIIAYNKQGSADTTIHKFITGEDEGYCLVNKSGNGAYQRIDLNNLHYVHPNPGNLDTILRYPAVAPYTTTLKRDTTYSLTKTNIYNQCDTYTAFIDFNQNGLFTEPGEMFPIVGGGGITQVAIPDTALLGITTMRIAVQGGCSPGTRVPCGRTGQDFTVTIIPKTACQAVSISPAINPIGCYGDSSGGIAINPSGGVAPYSIEWQKNGSFYSDSLLNNSNLSQGTYRAFVTDSNGCSLQTDLIPLVQPYPLQLDTQSNLSQYNLLASGGTIPYQFNWLSIDTNITTTNPNDSIPNGLYQLTLIDSNNCQKIIDSVLIYNSIVGIKLANNEKSGISVFPNPSTGVFTINQSPNATNTTAIVRDIHGKLVLRRQFLQPNFQLDLSGYFKGIYFLELKRENRTGVFKLIKLSE